MSTTHSETPQEQRREKTKTERKPNGHDPESAGFPPLNMAEIRSHVAMLHEAAAPLRGKGVLIVASFGEKDGTALPAKLLKVPVGSVDATVAAIAALSEEPHRNVYMPLAVYRPDIEPGRRKNSDVIAVLGAVADMDGPKVKAPFPLEPSFIIESSPGNSQPGILYPAPVPFDQARLVSQMLFAVVGGDESTKNPGQVWRIPGCRNWPNAKKLREGRPPLPAVARITEGFAGRTMAPDTAIRIMEPLTQPRAARAAAGDGVPVALSPERAREMLAHMSARRAFEKYGDWVEAGMILKDCYGDGGFDMWSSVTWADAEAVAESKWESFGQDRGGANERVGLGTLLMRAGETGFDWGHDPWRWFEPLPAEALPRAGLLLKAWDELQLPPREDFLGGILGRGSAWLISGQTGVGKTNLGLALAAAISAGSDFLGWKGSGAPRCVMYLDGEMGARPFQGRLRTVIRQYGADLRLYGYNRGRDDAGAIPPLDSEAGVKWLKRELDLIEPDALILDSIRYLTVGDITSEETWTRTGAIREYILKKEIAQIWLHHTGHDKSRAYGSSQIAWGMEASVILTKTEGDERSAAFRLEFDKAREKTPDNWKQFEPRFVRMTDDGWEHTLGQDDPRQRDRQAQERDDGLALLLAMDLEPTGTQRDWALTIGHAQATVGRQLARLKHDKLVDCKNSEWRITNIGRQYVQSKS